MHVNKAVNQIFTLEKKIENLLNKLDEIDNYKILTAQSIIKQNNSIESANNLSELEFKVFSQWGDDGIIQYLICKLNIDNKTFIEFGVEDYTESNTRFLLLNNNWRGLVIDGSEKNIEYIKNDKLYWRHSLIAENAFITTENINELFTNNGFNGEIGLLSIDIDGNDYHVWSAINTINPVIVIAEYNSVFGENMPYTIPYKPDFIRKSEGIEKLFYGASITSLCCLANEKGYAFIGCNSAGNNAYFIRNDKIDQSGFKELTPSEGFVESKFREANVNGNLFGVANKRDYFADFDVYNTLLKEIHKFGKI